MISSTPNARDNQGAAGLAGVTNPMRSPFGSRFNLIMLMKYPGGERMCVNICIGAVKITDRNAYESST